MRQNFLTKIMVHTKEKVVTKPHPLGAYLKDNLYMMKWYPCLPLKVFYG